MGWLDSRSPPHRIKINKNTGRSEPNTQLSFVIKAAVSEPSGANFHAGSTSPSMTKAAGPAIINTI